MHHVHTILDGHIDQLRDAMGNDAPDAKTVRAIIAAAQSLGWAPPESSLIADCDTQTYVIGEVVMEGLARH